MKGERHVIEKDGVLKIVGLQEYRRLPNKDEYFYHGKIQHKRGNAFEPISRYRVLELAKANVELLANKGHKNFIDNFKKLVVDKLPK
jgi:hypothetical protein